MAQQLAFVMVQLDQAAFTAVDTDLYCRELTRNIRSLPECANDACVRINMGTTDKCIALDGAGEKFMAQNIISLSMYTFDDCMEIMNRRYRIKAKGS